MHSRTATLFTLVCVTALFTGCDANPPLAPGAAEASLARGTSGQKGPSGLYAIALQGAIALGWQDNSPNETGFEVQRSTTGPGGAFTPLASTAANITSYSDTGLAAATQYCYEVRSFKRTGNDTSYSAFAGPACAATPPLTAPSAPTAVVISDTRIDVGWQDNSTNESGFELYRSTGGWYMEFARLASTGAGATSYTDAALAASTEYCYKVRAFQTRGGNTTYSEFSGAACAKTLPPPVPPNAPSLLYALPEGSTAVGIYWDPDWSSDPASTNGFRVERSIDGGGSWTTAGTDGAAWYNYSHYLSDGDRTPEQQVCYRVFASNRWGDSDPSGTKCATPIARPTGLGATTVDYQTIDFAWSDNSQVEGTYALGFFIYYYDDWGFEVEEFVPVWEGPANATSARVTGLESGTSYTYYVVAGNAFGRSDFSDGVTGTTDPAPPGIAGVMATRTRLGSPQPRHAIKARVPTQQRPRSAVTPRRGL